jgi:heterodisulfide reductase subunit A
MIEEPRIGVFICHCGINIGGVVNVPKVTEYAKTLPYVVHAEHNIYHKLNRVVVASCTPRTHEPLFKAACQEVGLNPYLFEMANIREHCSWVHMHEPEKATKKAMDIVRMAVAKAPLLEPQIEPEIEVKPVSLVMNRKSNLKLRLNPFH